MSFQYTLDMPLDGRAMNAALADQRREDAQRRGEQAQWLRAHEPTRNRPAAEVAKEFGPRALLEREVAEWMLADKEAHTGEDFGAQPRALPFAQFMEWNAPKLPPERKRLRRSEEQQRAAAQLIATQAMRCATLWRAVIEIAAIDLETKWGATQADRRESMMIFEPRSRVARDMRERLADLAMIEPEALQSAYEQGRVLALCRDAIGQIRWESRKRNAEPTAKQPDLFRSAGL